MPASRSASFKSATASTEEWHLSRGGHRLSHLERRELMDLIKIIDYRFLDACVDT
jgi:hypothetical protein